MSKALFDRLAEHAASDGAPTSRPEAGRYIKRLNFEDAKLLAEASATAVVVTRQVRFVRIEQADMLYFCTFGLPEPEESLAGLEIVPLTPGILTLAVLEAGVRPSRTVTAAMIKDAVDDYYVGNDLGYDGHELDDVSSFFPSIVVYRAIDTLEFHRITERVLGSILVRTYLDGPIPLEPDTVSNLARVFEAESPLIPFRNLIQGILSISWENLFVEIYRCVEQLYALPRVGRLKAAITYAASARELATILEDHLSWYPKEEEAFRALVRGCDEALVSVICAGLTGGQSDTHDGRCDAAVRELYSLRNRIVHYRPAHELIVKSDADWNIIVRGMLDVVSHLYSAHGETFFGPPQAPTEMSRPLTHAPPSAPPP